MDEDQIQFIAAQLRKPSGEQGVSTGEKMFENNGSMIRKAIDLLPVKEGDKVIELGYGNGAHLDYLFQKAEDLSYLGVDISDTMQKAAISKNQEKVKAGVAEFLLGDGIKIPAADAQADLIFTVNTIYFWEDHQAVLQEMLRVLKPGASLCIALASRNFMEKLPFTKYGFRMFHPEEAAALLQGAGFQISRIVVEEEEVPSILQDIKLRELILVLAQKPILAAL